MTVFSIRAGNHIIITIRSLLRRSREGGNPSRPLDSRFRGSDGCERLPYQHVLRISRDGTIKLTAGRRRGYCPLSILRLASVDSCSYRPGSTSLTALNGGAACLVGPAASGGRGPTNAASYLRYFEPHDAVLPAKQPQLRLVAVYLDGVDQRQAAPPRWTGPTPAARAGQSAIRPASARPRPRPRPGRCIYLRKSRAPRGHAAARAAREPSDRLRACLRDEHGGGRSMSPPDAPRRSRLSSCTPPQARLHTVPRASAGRSRRRARRSLSAPGERRLYRGSSWQWFSGVVVAFGIPSVDVTVGVGVGAARVAGVDVALGEAVGKPPRTGVGSNAVTAANVAAITTTPTNGTTARLSASFNSYPPMVD